MKKGYRLFKYFHFSLSIPPITFFSTKKVGFEEISTVMFTQDNIYSIYNDNQYDWNKLFGFKGEYFNPRYDAAMIGWRYNPDICKFELIPYFHCGSRCFIFDETKRIQLQVGEIGLIKIKTQVGWDDERECLVTEVIVELKNSRQYQRHKVQFKHCYFRLFRISSWFGGQEYSPINTFLNVEHNVKRTIF